MDAESDETRGRVDDGGKGARRTNIIQHCRRSSDMYALDLKVEW